jgi:hypothetical protein
MMKAGTITIKSALQTEYRERSEAEIFFLRMFLKTNVPFFANYEQDVLYKLCQSLKQSSHAKGELIARKGDLADKMHVVMVGQAGVYFDK